jgi:hypothetical protein
MIAPPPLSVSPPAPDSGVRLIAARRDLKRTLADLGRHTILLNLLDAADFSEDLVSDAPLTIFAPTDAAFLALLEAAEARPAWARVELCDVLEHHLVRGVADLTRAISEGPLLSVYGAAIHVDQDAGGLLRCGGARLRGAPVACSNGLVIPIDRVLLRPQPLATMDPMNPLATMLVDAFAGFDPSRVLADQDASMEPTSLAPRSEARATARTEEARAALLQLRPAMVRRMDEVPRGVAALLGLHPS